MTVHTNRMITKLESLVGDCRKIITTYCKPIKNVVDVVLDVDGSVEVKVMMPDEHIAVLRIADGAPISTESEAIERSLDAGANEIVDELFVHVRQIAREEFLRLWEEKNHDK